MRIVLLCFNPFSQVNELHKPNYWKGGKEYGLGFNPFSQVNELHAVVVLAKYVTCKGFNPFSQVNELHKYHVRRTEFLARRF